MYNDKGIYWVDGYWLLCLSKTKNINAANKENVFFVFDKNGINPRDNFMAVCK
jgi:hypothetical protein